MSAHIAEQALLFTRQRCQNDIIQQLNSSVATIDEYEANLSKISAISDTREIYNEEIGRMQSIVDNEDYMEALKVINHKGLLPYTQLTAKFGWKKDYYIDYVLLLIEKNDDIGSRLKQIFRQCIADI